MTKRPGATSDNGFILKTRLKCKSCAHVRIVVKKDWIVKKVDINCKSKKEEETEKNMLKIEKKLKNRVIWGKGDMKWKFKRKKWHEKVT